jgi:hypothetical protein
MSESPRRTFMKRTVALASAWALPSCAPEAGKETTRAPTAESQTLAALAGIVLPAASLGADGVRRVVEGFRKWLDELEPVAELDHAYISTDEILYGPADPSRYGRRSSKLSSSKPRNATRLPSPRSRGRSRRPAPRQLSPIPTRRSRSGESPHVALDFSLTSIR